MTDDDRKYQMALAEHDQNKARLVDLMNQCDTKDLMRLASNLSRNTSLNAREQTLFLASLVGMTGTMVDEIEFIEAMES